MDSRLRGNDVVVSFHSQKASISVRSILFQTFCDSRLRGNDVVLRTIPRNTDFPHLYAANTFFMFSATLASMVGANALIKNPSRMNISAFFFSSDS